MRESLLSGSRTAGRVRLAQEPFTEAERLACLTICPEEAAPFERGRAEIVRYPMLLRGWACGLGRLPVLPRGLRLP